MDRQSSPATPSSRSTTGPLSQPHSTNGAAASRTIQDPSSRSSRVPVNTNVVSGKKTSKIEASKKKPIPQPSKVAETKVEINQDQLLILFKNEFEAIRTLITCKICYGLMYEPFTSSCGHTYCYNCFCKSWPQNGSKACPECRTILRNPPAPSYLIRELTNLFIQRRELLPEDETIEQHAETQKEQRDGVQKDKISPKGLFRGHFGRPNRAMVLENLQLDSNVCPICLVDVENESGRCPQCQSRPEEYFEDPYLSEEDENFSYHGFSEPDTMSEDPEFDDMDDGFDGVIPDHDYDIAFGYGPDEEDEMDALDEVSAISNLVHYGANAITLSGFGGGGEGPFHSPRRATHSASASRRYSSSVMSDYPETEMGVLQEEDEDEDSSMSGVTDDNITTGTESPQSMHSARSTPSSLAAGQSPVSSASRRRRRADSNTPTPSMSQPSRRRRLSSRQSTPYYAMDSENTQAVDQDTEEEEEEEDSDGEVTTVGCEPTNESRNGTRAGGSLTPTADQPYPTTLPRSRASGSRSNVGSRSLRNRGSAVSMNTASHYEDNDADDDGSGPENSTTLLATRNTSRQRRPPVISTVVNDSDEGGVELDSDENDVVLRRANIQSRPVDERIREVFARQRTSYDDNGQVPPSLHELRSLNRTPLVRPRTANRNRTTAGASNSPASGPPTTSTSRNRIHFDVHINSSPIANTSAVNRAPLNYRDLVGQDVITRPDSRVSINRPPSTNGRRTSLNTTSASSNISPALTARYTLTGVSGNNPFRVRSNQPTRSLREQPSNTTIRPSTSSNRLRNSGSRTNVRAAPTSSPQERIQRVQTDFIDQQQLPRALNHTPSMMHLPQSILPTTTGSISRGNQVHTPSVIGSSTNARLRDLERMNHEERIYQRMEQAREHLVSRRANSWNGPPHHHAQHPQLSHSASSMEPTSHGMNITRPSANPFSRGATVQLAVPPPVQHSQRDYSAQTSNMTAPSVSNSNLFSHVTPSPTLLGTGPLGGINRRRSIRGLAPSSNLPNISSSTSGSGTSTSRTRTPQSLQINARMASGGSGRSNHGRLGNDG